MYRDGNAAVRVGRAMISTLSNTVHLLLPAADTALHQDLHRLQTLTSNLFQHWNTCSTYRFTTLTAVSHGGVHTVTTQYIIYLIFIHSLHQDVYSLIAGSVLFPSLALVENTFITTQRWLFQSNKRLLVRQLVLTTVRHGL